MEFVEVYNVTNYMDAHMLMGRLQEENINCWLKDENTVTLTPIWTNAVGGIKLMVPKIQEGRAKEFLLTWEKERKSHYACPNCGSHELELVTTPRKASNWISAIGTFLLGSYALAPDQVYHCFNCNAEFDQPIESSE
jgi:DNA-directed RNA polymerase subunit RPC12/RpoP